MLIGQSQTGCKRNTSRWCKIHFLVETLQLVQVNQLQEVTRLLHCFKLQLKIYSMVKKKPKKKTTNQNHQNQGWNRGLRGSLQKYLSMPDMILTMSTLCRASVLSDFLVSPFHLSCPALIPSFLKCLPAFHLKFPCILHHKQRQENSHKYHRAQQDVQVDSGRCSDPIARIRNHHLSSYLDQFKEVSCTPVTWLDPLLSLRVNIIKQVVQGDIMSIGFLGISNSWDENESLQQKCCQGLKQ